MKCWRDSRGFSLVEVLVVVAIIGLMAGVVVLSLPSESRDQRQAMERTERAFVAVSRNSIMTGRIIGLVINRDGFATVSLTDDGWVADNSILKAGARSWAPLELVSLSVDGADQKLSQSLGTTVPEPQIWFLPTGEHPAFELALESASGPMKLAAGASATPKVAYNE